MSDLFQDNNTFTPLNKIGEFGLIEHLTKEIKLLRPETIIGVGDDAAVLEIKENQVLSTDMLVEGIHFDFQYTPIKHLGYKAIVTNITDILAMNAEPTHVMVSLAISNSFSVEYVTQLYEGINAACQNYQIDIIGGDTTSSKNGLVISISIIGKVSKDKISSRKGAKEGDLIGVTGNVGAAFAGLSILLEKQKEFEQNNEIQPDLSEYSYCLQRQLRPEAPMKFIKDLKNLKIKLTSMIDISDGLGSELCHLSNQSKVGFKIFEEKIPIDFEAIKIFEQLQKDYINSSIYGGEDYELLFTISSADFEQMKELKDISWIGHTVSDVDAKVLIKKDGSQTDINQEGWNAFKG